MRIILVVRCLDSILSELNQGATAITAFGMVPTFLVVPIVGTKTQLITMDWSSTERP